MIFMITGKAGSGKDTTAKIIQNLTKKGDLYTFSRVAFADKLKGIALTLGWNGAKDEKGRKFLQDLGTVARNYNENVWAELAVDDILPKNDIYEGIVVTDWRYKNEYEVISKYIDEVVTVRVTGREYDLGKLSSHSSENSLNNFNCDFDIDNSGTIEETTTQIKEMLLTLKIIQKV